jgi:hypothetical protein
MRNHAKSWGSIKKGWESMRKCAKKFKKCSKGEKVAQCAIIHKKCC